MTIFEFGDKGLAAQGDLVEAVAAMDHHHVPTAERLQHLGQGADEATIEHAEQLVRRISRIGERSQQIEQRPHAQRLAHWRGVLHGAVVVRREQEAQSHRIDQLADTLRASVQVDAEMLQDIGAAAAGAHRASAVLGDFCATRGGDKGGGGGDVEGVQRVAAGAAGVDQMATVSHHHLGRELAHHLGGGGDLGDCLAFAAQRDDRCGDLRRLEFAAHQRAHQVEHFLAGEVLPRQQAVEGVLVDHVGLGLGG